MKRWWSKIARRIEMLNGLRHRADLFLFLRILFFAAAVPAIMRLKLPRLSRILEPRQIPATADPVQVRDIIRYVDTAIQFGRPLVQPKCLTRGLTLYTFLRRAGLDVELCFGAEKSGEEFDGHCWLVKDGEPYLEADDPRPHFKPLYCLQPPLNKRR